MSVDSQVITEVVEGDADFAEKIQPRVGLGSLFVPSRSPPSLGKRITLRFTAPDGTEKLRVEGAVSWRVVATDAPKQRVPGFGLTVMQITDTLGVWNEFAHSAVAEFAAKPGTRLLPFQLPSLDSGDDTDEYQTPRPLPGAVLLSQEPFEGSLLGWTFSLRPGERVLDANRVKPFRLLSIHDEQTDELAQLTASDLVTFSSDTAEKSDVNTRLRPISFSSQVHDEITEPHRVASSLTGPLLSSEPSNDGLVVAEGDAKLLPFSVWLAPSTSQSVLLFSAGVQLPTTVKYKMLLPEKGYVEFVFLEGEAPETARTTKQIRLERSHFGHEQRVEFTLHPSGLLAIHDRNHSVAGTVTLDLKGHESFMLKVKSLLTRT